MSFACPHFEPDHERCIRLDTDCVPGRPGCVLGSGNVFAVPVEERLRESIRPKFPTATASGLTCIKDGPPPPR